MLFLTLNNTNIKFAEIELFWRLYTTAKALPTTKQVELINKKKFAKMVLDKNLEIFMIYVIALEVSLVGNLIHPS